MYWSDEEEKNTNSALTDKTNFVFQLVGTTLPQNYLSGFAHAFHRQITWWNTEAHLGFHLIIAGEEGNGWFRGDNPQDVIYLSRRNMLVIRAPTHLAQMIEALSGVTFDVFQHHVKLKHKHNKAISPAPTLYSQHMVCHNMEEDVFITQVVGQLAQYDIKCKKLLCGKKRMVSIDGVNVVTRSLMLEDLAKEDALLIQAVGLDAYQKFGCGVFVPHKSVK